MAELIYPPICECGHVPEEHGLVLDVGCHADGCKCAEYESAFEREEQV